MNSLGIWATWCGRFGEAVSLIAEGDAIAEATGTRFAPFADVILAGFRGSEAEATRLIEVVTKDARTARQGVGIQWCQLVSGILYNGLGRYDKALAEARQATEQAPELYVAAFALPELIEAASRTGQTQIAADALDRLAEATSVSQTDWGQGIYARPRALLSDGETAETCYREAIERLSRTPLRPDLARAHLLYGSGCAARAAGPTHARSCIPRTACSTRPAWRRSPSGPAASWPPPAKPPASLPCRRDTLTPQEAQIALLASKGMSNPEIAAQLFLSPRTIEWHLRKVFTKLDISSRRQLQRALPDGANATRLA